MGLIVFSGIMGALAYIFKWFVIGLIIAAATFIVVTIVKVIKGKRANTKRNERK